MCFCFIYITMKDNRILAQITKPSAQTDAETELLKLKYLPVVELDDIWGQMASERKTNIYTDI